MKSKKAASLALEIIVIAVIVLIVLVVIIAIFGGQMQLFGVGVTGTESETTKTVCLPKSGHWASSEEECEERGGDIVPGEWIDTKFCCNK